MKRLALFLLLFTTTVRASWITNNFGPSVGLNMPTINLSFNPTQTPFIATNGQIIYSVQVGATATNGILTPTWLVGGKYQVTIGPVPDPVIINCPIDNNTYSLWSLITNANYITNFQSQLVLGVAPGVGITTSTNAGVVTVNSSGGRGSSPSDPYFYGAIGNGITDDSYAVQQAIDYADTNSGVLILHAGNYLVQSLDFTFVNNGITIQSDGPGSVVFVPHLSGYPVMDMIGANYIHVVGGFRILSTNGFIPSCGIAIGRFSDADDSGQSVFDNVYIAGAFQVATVYTIASEINTWNNCIFGQQLLVPHYSNATACFYCAESCTNIYGTNIVSLYTTTTASGTGGNSFQTWNGCNFIDGDNFQQSTCLVDEFTLSHQLNMCYFYSQAATNQILLQHAGIEWTMLGCRQESGTPTPNFGIYISDPLTYQDIGIYQSSIFPILATNLSIVDGLNFRGSYFNGTNNVNLTVLNFDTIRNSDIQQSIVLPNMGNRVMDGRWMCRNSQNLSGGNKFQGIYETNLSGYFGDSMRFTQDGRLVIEDTNTPKVLLTVIGGAISGSISNLVNSNSPVGFTIANPAITLSPGYAGNGASFWQSFNNVTTNANTLALNPFGGEVGIGTTNPQATFDINGSLNVRSVTTFSNVVSNYSTYYGISPVIPLTISGGQVSSTLANSTANYTFRFDLANPVDSIVGGYAGTDVPFIQAVNNVTHVADSFGIQPFGGDVGVGNLNPQATLDVTGSGNFSGSVEGLEFLSTNATGTNVVLGNSIAISNGPPGGPLTNVLTITTNGGLIVAGTVTAGSFVGDGQQITNNWVPVFGGGTSFTGNRFFSLGYTPSTENAVLETNVSFNPTPNITVIHGISILTNTGLGLGSNVTIVIRTNGGFGVGGTGPMANSAMSASCGFSGITNSTASPLVLTNTVTTLQAIGWSGSGLTINISWKIY